MTPLLGPVDGDWTRWGSPLDRKADALAQTLRARDLPWDEARIRAMDERQVDAELAALGIRAWTPGGLGHVGWPLPVASLGPAPVTTPTA